MARWGGEGGREGKEEWGLTERGGLWDFFLANRGKKFKKKKQEWIFGSKFEGEETTKMVVTF